MFKRGSDKLNSFFNGPKPGYHFHPVDLDLKCVLALTLVAAGLIYLPVIEDSVIRSIFCFAAFVFAPGYAFIAALFPRKSDMGVFERLVLSICFSIAIMSLIGLMLNYSPWGIHLDQLVLCLVAFTVPGTVIANRRRHGLAVEERFSINVRDNGRYLLDLVFFGARAPGDKMLAILVVLSIVAVAGVLVYAVVEPGHGELFTEFYILDAGHQADNYPTIYQPGEAQPMIIGVTNHEGRPMDYDIIVALNNSTASSVLYATKMKLADNQTSEISTDLDPNLTGSNLKMEFLLYADGNMTVPYRECHLWVNVLSPNVSET